MKIGFFTVFRQDPQHYVLAGGLIKSIRAVMPDVEIVQFSDETSPAVLGINDIIRKPNGPMLERRIEHYSECEGEWLLLDTDVWVKADVRSVFDDQGFDVALADRNWPHLPQPHDIWATMPFNTGVVFSRSGAFWAQVLEEWRKAGRTDWMSEQRAAYSVVRTGVFKVKILDGMVYNYPPLAEKDPSPGAAIVHYKGARKHWMRGAI